jgi:hypothetical protein
MNMTSGYEQTPIDNLVQQPMISTDEGISIRSSDEHSLNPYISRNLPSGEQITCLSD